MAISIDTRSIPAGALDGAVLPGDAAYEAARQNFNLAVAQHPAAIAYPRSAADVARTVRAARAAGLRVAVQGGMHNAGPQGDLRDAVLIRTANLDGMRIDPAARRARVGAGVLWEPVVNAAAPHGLAALHGSSPDVGIVGYSLGGGLGWLARRHGLQANRITAAELVLADGERVRVDERHDADLFWALRGGGGNFGVVTALEFELLAIEQTYAGQLVWDWTESERVLQRWAEWAPDAPEDVTTTARILQLPPLPEVPEALRGRKIVMINGAVLGDPDVAAEIIAPLRELQPEIDTFATVPMPALSRLHGDPEEPLPYETDAAMLSALPPEAVSAFVEVTGHESGSSLVVAELRQLGGAVGRPAPGHGAVSHFDGAFLAFALGMAFDPDTTAATRADTRRAIGALAPWHGGRPYLNFVEEETDVATAYTDATYARLQAIRESVDPAGLFRANHVIA